MTSSAEMTVPCCLRFVHSSFCFPVTSHIHSLAAGTVSALSPLQYPLQEGRAVAGTAWVLHDYS